MASRLQDTNVSDIDWDNLTLDDLDDLAANDDRDTVKTKAASLAEERRAPAPVLTLDEYDPRQDPGPPRHEDIVAAAEDETPVDDQLEVPLEDSVKDHTTVLASDTFDNEGNLTNRVRPEAPEPAQQ